MRLRKLLGGVLAVALLTGFVPFTEKVLEKCRRATPAVRHTLRITLDDRPGRLFVATPGSHAIILDDGTKLADPGLDALLNAEEGAATRAKAKDSLLALWRFLDYYSPSRPEDLTELMVPCMIDLNRRGLVRLDDTGDRVGISIGAFGESEADFPQAWIDRETYRLVRLTLPDQTSVSVVEFGSEGVPARLDLNKGARTLVINANDAPPKKR